MANDSVKITKQQTISCELMNELRAGRYGAGRRMPSENALARRFNVSRVTVRLAIKELEEKGLVSRRPGSGTYANVFPPLTKEFGASKPRPDRAIRQIAFLLADASEKEEYNVRELAAMDQCLSAHGIALAWSSFNTADLIEGRFPAVLVHGLCDGLLLDGQVTDVHTAIARRFQLPLLVMGNHDLAPETPHVSYVLRPRICQAVADLRQAKPEMPVALLIEPFTLFVSREITAAYQDGITAARQPQALIYQCPADTGQAAVTALAAGFPKGFSIITTDRILPTVLDSYDSLGFKVVDRPVFSLNSRPRHAKAEKVPGLRRAFLNPEHIAQCAVEQMIQMLRQGVRTSIFEYPEEEEK